MEYFRPRPALDRQVKSAPAVLLALLLPIAAAQGHAGSWVLAKCVTGASGNLTLVLTVDYSQHPLLTTRPLAEEALRQVLQWETPAGPVALESVADGALTWETVPDPDLPVPAEPGDETRAHSLAVMRYSWDPGVPEVRFSVPGGNPHDVLFWLAGEARAKGQPALWRLLIAGDLTPPIPIPPAPRVGLAARGILAAAITLGLVGLVVWRRFRQGRNSSHLLT